MSSFRFAPAHTGRLFAASVTALIVVLALPAILVATLPEPHREREQVKITSVNTDWKVTVPHLLCESDPYAMSMQGWTCGDTSVQVANTEATDDPERTLRRQVKAYSMLEFGEEGDVISVDDNFLYYSSGDAFGQNLTTVGMTVKGTDDDVLFVLIDGSDEEDVAIVGSQIWEAMTGKALDSDLLEPPAQITKYEEL
ncbi:hypothetical protein QP027_00190 [Corynebacterium breve]|uniref:DUF4245 domain-containing protein n=1 Tax=Corynebacterium breve TaxID=3049799 RepID=A0ABY8VFG9_9CORY|nr:hypothetical protein [Corynebacterium breve]WIM67862.1 hypothetical protein QP027_00190 [Corynebacterium breve]